LVCSKAATSEISEDLQYFGQDLNDRTHGGLRRTSVTLLFRGNFLLRWFHFVHWPVSCGAGDGSTIEEETKMKRLIATVALLITGFVAASTEKASAVVYCQYVEYPAGCVVRPGVVLRPRPAAGVVVAPGVDVRPVDRPVDRPVERDIRR
jgi:hypothetical protein